MSFYSPNNFVSAYTCFICVYQLHTVTDVTFKGAAIFLNLDIFLGIPYKQQRWAWFFLFAAPWAPVSYNNQCGAYLMTCTSMSSNISSFPSKPLFFLCVEKPLNLLLMLRKGTFYSEPFPKPKQIVWMGTMNQINEKKIQSAMLWNKLTMIFCVMYDSKVLLIHILHIQKPNWFLTYFVKTI